MTSPQNFDPLGNPILSTSAAAIPVWALFYFLAVRRTAAWVAAVFGFVQIAGYVVADQLQTTAVTCFELLSGGREGKLAVCALRFFYRNPLNRKIEIDRISLCRCLPH
jgi:hypothetical protein